MGTKLEDSARKRYVEAKAAAARLARKEGTPENDPRAHHAAVERERRAREAIASKD